MRKNCVICNTEFNVDAWSLKNRACRYCSRKCASQGRKNGEYHSCIQCRKEFYIIPAYLKRRSTNGLYCSTDCMYKSSLRTQKLSGKNNYLWKGDRAGYHAKHEWIRKQLGKASKCRECGATENVAWSNRDHKYSRNFEDWQELCSKCHTRYDIEHKYRLVGRSLYV